MTERPGRVDARYVLRLASRLTERDRTIAVDCYEHRVLTTEQLRRLHFGTARSAQRRLTELYELRVLDRFRPPWVHGEPTPPYHWVLDEAGAHLVAERLGLERRQLRFRHYVALAVASSPKLAHQLEVNEFLTQLAVEARDAGGALREWWGERRGAQALGGIVAPDAYAEVELPGERVAFLLELDRGTEDLARLQAKARRYAKALPRSVFAERPPPVLLAVRTSGRATRVVDALSDARARIAPIVWLPDESPLAAVREALREGARLLRT